LNEKIPWDGGRSLFSVQYWSVSSQDAPKILKKMAKEKKETAIPQEKQSDKQQV
jgi:hypothetical protein